MWGVHEGRGVCVGDLHACMMGGASGSKEGGEGGAGRQGGASFPARRQGRKEGRKGVCGGVYCKYMCMHEAPGSRASFKTLSTLNPKT